MRQAVEEEEKAEEACEESELNRPTRAPTRLLTPVDAPRELVIVAPHVKNENIRLKTEYRIRQYYNQDMI